MYAFLYSHGKLYFDISKYSFHYALMRKQEMISVESILSHLKIVYNVGKRACKMKQYYFV